MSTITVDCRGLACPGPVLRCMEAIDKDAPEAMLVLVDDPGALENVSRLLAGKGYAVTQQVGSPGQWTVSAQREGSAPVTAAAQPSCAPSATPDGRSVVFIPAETMGAGDEGLGGKLMLNFLSTLPELGQGLWRIILVNGGVKLACEGHPCLEKLAALEAAGVDVLVCGTCLGFFGLTEAKRVGQTTNMLDVVTSLDAAGKVIRA